MKHLLLTATCLASISVTPALAAPQQAVSGMGGDTRDGGAGVRLKK